LEYNLTAGSNWRRTVHFIIEAEKIRPELESRYAEYQKKARIEGFRKGKVPPALMKKMFGKSIEADVFQPHISAAYEKFFDENKLDLISTPEIHDIRYDDQNGLQFELHFDVRPEFEVTGYQGMPVEQEIFQVGEEDVERTLQSLRERNAMVYNVDGAAAVGHYLLTTIQELDRTGVPLLGKKFDQQILWLGESDQEITPQLVGVKPGEERRMRLKAAPQEAVNPEKPQPDKLFQVMVHEVKDRRLPELDDEFARDLGAFQTLDELRQDVDKRLRMQAELEGKLRFEQAIGDELIKRMNIEVPPSMLEAYLTALARDVQKNSKEKISEAEVREQYRTAAIRNLKWILIRDRLAKQQSLEISDEELDGIIAQVAERGEEGAKRAEELKKDPKARQRFRDDLEDDRIYAFLAAAAEVKKIEKPWRTVNEPQDHQHES